MITEKERLDKREIVENGTLRLYKLLEAPEKPEKLRTYARAILAPGGAVEFHEHHGESESYYILSGKGLYNDNGIETEVHPGDITYTPSGSGHGIKNTGSEDLHFMALIVLE